MLDDEGTRGVDFDTPKDANAGHVRYYTEDLQSSALDLRVGVSCRQC